MQRIWASIGDEGINVDFTSEKRKIYSKRDALRDCQDEISRHEFYNDV